MITLLWKPLKSVFFFLVLLALIFPLALNAEEFEILSVKGLVELSTDQKKWEEANPPQKIVSGTWIRTGSSASAALVLPNKTQTRIAKNSELLLKSKEKKSQVKLKLGKLWSKTNKKPVELKINAPNAVASIRGTEWVVEVDQNGESSLAVMEGEIELASSSGDTKSIASGSVAAVNKSGKISVAKIINPEEYLQFIYRYRIEPLASKRIVHLRLVDCSNCFTWYLSVLPTTFQSIWRISSPGV